MPQRSSPPAGPGPDAPPAEDADPLLEDADPLLDPLLDPAQDELWEEDPTTEELEPTEAPDLRPLPLEAGEPDPIEEIDDEGGSDLEALDDLSDPPPPAELPVLPWRMQARLPSLNREIEVLLDPTRAHSRWRAPDHEEGRLRTRLQLGELRLQVELRTCRGAEELRLGRDALAGRVAVSSEAPASELALMPAERAPER